MARGVNSLYASICIDCLPVYCLSMAVLLLYLEWGQPSHVAVVEEKLKIHSHNFFPGLLTDKKSSKDCLELNR